jgi:hypothetical protein
MASRRKTLAREASSDIPVARLMRLPREGPAAPTETDRCEPNFGELTDVPALFTRALAIGRRTQLGQHGTDQLTQRTPRILANRLILAPLRSHACQRGAPGALQSRGKDRPWRSRSSPAARRATRQCDGKAASAVGKRHDGARGAQRGGEDRTPRNHRPIAALDSATGSHARRHDRRDTAFTAFTPEPRRLRQPAWA